jgi:hypothetical protein
MGASHGMLDPGNVSISAPYFIAGKSGALTLPAAGSPVATLQNLGRFDTQDPARAILAVPLRISRVRVLFTPSTLTAPLALEVFKGLVVTQHTVGGNVRTPTRRKTTGYPAIPATEVNLFVATTGAISGGSFTPDGDGFLMASGGVATGFGSAEAIWTPSDLCPLTLEAGEGIEVRTAVQGGGVGNLHVCFDFLRQ